MNLRIDRLARAAAALLFVSAIALNASAQRASSPRRGSTTASPTAADMARSEMEREMMDKELEESGAPGRRERKDSQHLFTQVSEDFTRIQILNNELVRAASRDDALDLLFVAKSAAEIRKRAQRLKTNMALPEPDKPPAIPRLEAGAGIEQMKSSLLTLGKLIAGFAHNPVFKEAHVVDAQQSAKARADLEAIIELSGQVLKGSERLSKSGNKPQ